ncbi:MAG: acyl-CoA dehydrogenase family protein [Acidimicrobiales bacterium]
MGEVNGGWHLITNQLNQERVSLCAAGASRNTVNQIIDWARDTEHPDGGRVIDQEWVQVKLAEMRPGPLPRPAQLEGRLQPDQGRAEPGRRLVGQGVGA